MKAKTFPSGARLAAINGILRMLIHNKGRMGIAELSRMSDSEVDTLLPQVNAATMLKLVKVVGDNISITKLGKDFHINDEAALKKARNLLIEIEPFKTAHALSKKKDKFSTVELAEELERKEIVLDIDKDMNISLLNTMLFHWAIYFSIIDHYGISGYWKEDKSEMR